MSSLADQLLLLNQAARDLQTTKVSMRPFKALLREAYCKHSVSDRYRSTPCLLNDSAINRSKVASFVALCYDILINLPEFVHSFWSDGICSYWLSLQGGKQESSSSPNRLANFVIRFHSFGKQAGLPEKYSFSQHAILLYLKLLYG